MMVTQVSDPLGNTITSVPDYRLLVPKQLTDPNGNRSAAAFDELGRILKAALMGKEGGSDGDTLEDPTQEFEYVTDEWSEHQRPNYTHTKARKAHGGTAQWQQSYVYSDGSGRVAMTKIQAEPGDAPDLDEETGDVVLDGGEVVYSDANPRWVGTGRTILNNKGAPVKQYEPYFSRTHAFETDEHLVKWGVTPVIHYDPIGRAVRVDLPNGSYRRMEYGVWKATVYDENDTVGEVGNLWSAERSGRDPSDPEFKAYDQALAHANTPSRSYADTMGRPFLAIAHNIDSEDEAEFICTRTELDIEGQPKTVTDPLGRACQTHAFSIGGQLLLETNIDKGSRRMLLTVLGEPLRKWDDRDQRFRVQYDDLRRPTHLYLQVGEDDEVLLERRYYGDNAGIDDPEDDNLKGQLVALYDGAGLVQAGPFDFKGNPLASSRQLVANHELTPDWIDIAGVTSVATSESTVASLLTGETFSESREYDALNRLVSATAPDGSVFTPTYNEASLLEAVEVGVRGGAARTFVRSIDYDAKGQRTRIEYSDEDPGDAMADAPTFLTEYTYDPLTFRLSKLVTTRVSDSRALQDLTYTLDPVGNIVRIVDDAYQPIFFNNAVVLPENSYFYDAVYRLIKANGREHASIGDAQVDDTDTAIVTVPHANMSDAVRNYEETFGYDKVGNILSMFHDAEGSPHATWTRTYSYTSGTNRLASHSAPGGSVSFSYDEHGSMTVMPHLSTIENNPYDQMLKASNGSQDTYFQYGADGQRVRKVFDTHSNLLKERIYLGSFEIYREIVSSAIDFERQTLHVMDGIKRIATVETKTVEDGDPVGSTTSLIRFQLGNHLGSAMLEVDEEGSVVSYEEYHPYGTSAYRAAASGLEVAKRYRFNGKERDEETGLYYYGARYYAAWLGRWTSADPLGIRADGPGVYNYTRGSPVVMTDPNGMFGFSTSKTIAAVETARTDEQIANGVVATESADSTPEDVLTGQTCVPQSTATKSLIAKGPGAMRWSDVPVVDPEDVREPGNNGFGTDMISPEEIQARTEQEERDALYAAADYDAVDINGRELWTTNPDGSHDLVNRIELPVGTSDVEVSLALGGAGEILGWAGTKLLRGGATTTGGSTYWQGRGKYNDPWTPINVVEKDARVVSQTAGGCTAACGEMMIGRQGTGQQLATEMKLTSKGATPEELAKAMNVVDAPKTYAAIDTGPLNRAGVAKASANGPWVAGMKQNVAGTGAKHAIIVDGVNAQGRVMVRDPIGERSYEISIKEFKKFYGEIGVFR